MINRTSPVRRHSRFPVRWHLLYGGDEFLAEGTALDLTHRGWRVAGPMPVAPGMRLRLQVSIPDREEPLCIRQATVLWANDREFAIEVCDMAPEDQEWVGEFLRQKLGLMWMSSIADHRLTGQRAAEEMPNDRNEKEHQRFPTIENLMGQLLTPQTPSEENAVEALQNDPPIEECHYQPTAHDTPIKEVRYQAFRLLCGMLDKKATRERTGRDTTMNN